MDNSNFDTNRKFVRVIEVRDNGMVEFEFAIGEPELFVELLLPAPAFREFCERNAVTMIGDGLPAGDRTDDGSDEAQWHWNLRQATHQRFR